MYSIQLNRSMLFFGITLLIGLSAASGQKLTLDAKVEKIASGFEFVEGPVWKDGRLLF